MKWTKTLGKNFKILARSKGSALMVLLAPLLIVLIIGLSFAGNKENTTHVGIYLSDNNNNLTNRFITNLNTSDNTLTIFSTSNSCINAIKEGVVVTCIVFPQNFAIADNKTNQVVFYVDESRLNLVYKLIASLTVNVNVESTEVSKELTQQLLFIMDQTKKDVDDSVALSVGMKAKTSSLAGKSADTKTKVSSMNMTTTAVNMATLKQNLNNVTTDYNNLKSRASSVRSEGYSVLADLNITSGALMTALQNLDISLSGNDSTASTNDFNALNDAINNLATQVTAMQNQLAEAKNVQSTVLSTLNSLSSDITSLSTDLDNLKIKQEGIRTRINSFSLKSAESISHPITTKVESVVAKNNKITYSFPYLLMMVVLFVGIMLSSTIVFMEKDSRAFFRNFTTPTKSAHFIMMNYFTSFIILVAQCIIILAAVYFGLHVPALTNIGLTTLFLFLGITVFILIGMIVGSIFSTSEAITMSTIAIGSVLLFLSNLILPLETLSPLIGQIARFNPYVLASEGIKKAMLFQSTFQDLYFELIVLAAYCIILLIIVISIKRIITLKFFDKVMRRRHKMVFTVPEDHYLRIDDKNIIVRSVPELLETLKHMSNHDYATLTKPNVFTKWLRESLNEKRLALKLEGKSLDSAIKILEKYVKSK